MRLLRHNEIYRSDVSLTSGKLDPECRLLNGSGPSYRTHQEEYALPIVCDEFRPGIPRSGWSPPEPVFASPARPACHGWTRERKRFSANGDLSLFKLSHLRGAVHETFPGFRNLPEVRVRFRNRRAILARRRSARIHTRSAIVRNGLPTAHEAGVVSLHDQLMPAPGQFLPHVRRYPPFHPDVASAQSELSETRRFQSRLQVHFVVGNIRYKLGLRLCLIDSAHNPKADMFIAAFHKAGNNGVKRPLARAQRVRVFRVQRERSAAVVQKKTKSLDRDARAENVRDALDPAHNISLLVHHAQIRGVAMALFRLAGMRITIGPIAGDQGGPFLGIGFGKQRVCRDRCKARIADVALEILRR